MSNGQPPVRARNGAATRARIEREALHLFARHGVEGTSIRDLALAVGVADAALYRHFSSKDEIARALFCAHYRSIAARIEATAALDAPFALVARALVEVLCRLFDEEPDVFAFVLLNQHAHLRFVPVEGNVVVALRDIMQAARARGEIDIADPDLAAAMALGAVLQPAIFKLYGRLPGTMGDLAPALTQAVLRVLGGFPH
ncbi:MAG: transcriptional regulator, TetR family [Hyphomicrobiales bacterium]|nr:transcriptional regulator, TetR family [Hyphomicrobiales bacterium]